MTHFTHAWPAGTGESADRTGLSATHQTSGGVAGKTPGGFFLFNAGGFSHGDLRRPSAAVSQEGPARRSHAAQGFQIKWPAEAWTGLARQGLLGRGMERRGLEGMAWARSS